MRLTLRTLLAYIDNILEPADAQEISKKVEESEFATNLMHRMRDVSRRLRLGAPKLEGRGMALDTNTVAEYLDNTLVSERVPEFEKICLESDMHLAEVVSAHQILTLVLGEPAEIDTELRERMYRLGTGVTKQTTAPRPSDTPIPSRTPMPSTTPGARDQVLAPAIETNRASRNKPEVPDYLREPPATKGSGARLVAAALVMIIVGAAVAGILNLERLQEKLGMRPRESQIDESTVKEPTPDDTERSDTEKSATSPGPTDEPSTAPSPTESSPATVAGAMPADGQPESPAAPTPSDQPVAMPAPNAGPAAPMPLAQPTPEAGLANPVAPMPTAPAPASPGTGATVPATVATAPAGAATLPPASGTPATSPSSAPAPGPAGPSGPGVAGPAMTGTAPAPGPGAPAPAAPMPSAPVAGPAVVAPAKPTSNEEVGRFMEGELLLRFTSTDGLWHRVPMRATVFGNDRIMSLPTYRCALTLATGMSVDLLGGTEVLLGPPDPQGVPSVEILDGRVMLLSAGAPTAIAAIGAANRRGQLVLSDTNSSAAIEVRHRHLEGSNPEKTPSAVEFEIYVMTGKVDWLDANATQPESIVAPARRVLVGESQNAVNNEPPAFPTWVTAVDERRQSQKLASAELSKALPTDRPVTLGLKELAGDRKIETSLLAIQCLAQIGDFDTLVTALKDPNQKAAWNEEIEALRTAIARSPETAAAVRSSFERHYGARSVELYRMLWGYTGEQINSGAGAQLVKYLDAEDLEYRVLAFAALTRLTGGATHFYRPEYPAARRQQYILKWKQRLDSGQLVPKTTTSP